MGKLISFPIERIRKTHKAVKDEAYQASCKLYLFTGIRYERDYDVPIPPETAQIGRGSTKRKRRQT